jgi:hypothetical protein
MRSGKIPWSEALNDNGTKGDLTRCPFDAKMAAAYKYVIPWSFEPAGLQAT